MGVLFSTPFVVLTDTFTGDEIFKYRLPKTKPNTYTMNNCDRKH